MTRYPTPLEQQYGADQANLRQRVAVLERQMAQTASLAANTAQLVKPVILTASTASVTFSAVPAYTNLQLVWRAQLSAAGPTDVLIQIDGSGGSNYLWAKLSGHLAAASSSNSGALTTSSKIGVVGGLTAGYFANGIVNLAGWSSSTGYLTMSGTSCTWNAATADWEEVYSGLYAAVGPHTSLTVFPATGSFTAGSEFSLYGMS